jgi:hypothetical protein
MNMGVKLGLSFQRLDTGKGRLSTEYGREYFNQSEKKKKQDGQIQFVGYSLQCRTAKRKEFEMYRTWRKSEIGIKFWSRNLMERD